MAEVNLTTGLTQDMQTYYEKVFLARAQYELILKEGAQMRTQGKYSGKTINFTQYQPLTVSTTPLAEASNPGASQITASTVSMTLSEYGNTVITSKLHELTSIDSNFKEAVALVGQNMGETLNALVKNELSSATVYFPNSRNVSTVTTGDTLNACAIRGMVQALEIAKASPYKDGFYIGKTNPQSKYNLLGDSTWVAAKEYSDPRDLYLGEPISPLFLKFGGREDSLIPSEGGLSNVQISILIGSLLGDGCLWKQKAQKITRKGKEYTCKTDAYTFEEQHTEKQKDYLAWKAGMLFPYANVSIVNRDFGKVYKLVVRPGRGKNKVKTALNILHRMFYPNGKKIIPKELITFMNDLVFAVWFFDDGTLSIKGKESKTLKRNNLKKMARLSTCAFSYKDQLKIARALHKKLSIQPTIRKESGYYRMTFKSMNGMFNKVRDILETARDKYGVGGMDYKIPQRVETKWGTTGNSRRYSPN